MTTFIALLRGINVSGHNRIPMADLRQLCSELGYENVATYIQSGNVVLTVSGDVSEVEATLERGIGDRFGLVIPVVVRTANRWASYVKGNPFPAASEREPNHVLMGLAKAPPMKGATAALRERATANEKIELVEDALWIHYAGGVARSKLTPAIIDRVVGSSVTARNFRTVQQLAVMAASLCALFFAVPTLAAEEPSRPPLPEALLTESATDVDAKEGGEIEYEANLATVRARRGGARATLTSLEVEWRVFKEVGLRVEPSYTRFVDVRATSPREAFGIGGAIALGLFHDFAHDFHLQAELLGRTPEAGNGRVFDAAGTELPFAGDLVAAIRRHRWTVRATVGAEAGGSFAHAPLHTDLALMTGILPEERFGFVVVEARADWARDAPLVIAPEIVADTTPIGLPFRLGLALPINVGAEATHPSYGMSLRLILLTSREVDYGRARHVSSE